MIPTPTPVEYVTIQEFHETIGHFGLIAVALTFLIAMSLLFSKSR